MLLYLVRHGETDLNIQEVYQGHSQTPLNVTGKGQAEKLSQALRYVPFRECWSSPLPRAEETAKIVLDEYHTKTSMNLDPLLSDRSMGALEGKRWTEPIRVGQGVETDHRLDNRLRKFLSNLIQVHTPLTSPINSPRTPVSPTDPGSGCVLIVTHEACLLSLLRILTGSQTMKQCIPNGNKEEDQLEVTRKERVVDTRIPLTVDVGKQCGNTAVCVMRVWWEEGEELGKLEAKGRIEQWADLHHLVEDD